MADFVVISLIIVLVIALIMLYLMNIRIKQLEKELRDVRSRMALTDEELTRLAHDIEDFKKLDIT